MSSDDYSDTAESKESAMKEVAAHLNKPEFLDRLSQYKRKITRKKTTIESQLRNAVQTQLDGVQKGLQTLQDLEKTVREVKVSVGEVERLYQNCGELSEVVKPIKEVNRNHQQLKTTTLHIHNIFNVPTVVKVTQDLIQENRLLEAHRNLAELEHTRDELFIQLYQSEDAFVDKNTSLHHYFEPLGGLSDTLGQQLWLTMNQVTGLVSSTPSQVVSALRIVEREEKTDAIVKKALDERGIPATQLPGRPKNWREKCLQILETAISNKYEKLEPSNEEKLENKGWLQEHLVSVASFAYTDLQAMKESGAVCFPPSYNILKFFIKCHHACLAKKISQLVSDDPNARDIIPLLIWIGDIRESFNETLDVDLTKCGPLIDPATEVKLQGRCQKQVEDNVQALVTKMVEAEQEEMHIPHPPETDIDAHYYTTVGITLFQMVDQNISALGPLGVMNKLKILSICLMSVSRFQRLYKEALEFYHQKHVESQRREPPCYFQYMIAAANNCRSCMEFAGQLKERFKIELPLEPDHEKTFKQISDDFETIAHYWLVPYCDCLVEVMFLDLAPLFSEFFHKESWFNHPGVLIGKVEGTLVDYNEDFNYLKQVFHSYVMIETQHRTMFLYMQAMLSKRIVFKNKKDREKATGLIKEDARRISNVFNRLSHATNPKYTKVVEDMAGLISASQEYLILDLAAMGKEHPDVRVNHIVAVLAMRGDLNRGLVQKLMQQTELKEQQPDELLQAKQSGSGSGSGLRITAAMRKKKEEKFLFQSLAIPNPYNLVAK